MKYLYILLFTIAITGCNQVFDYSPYSAKVDSNETNRLQYEISLLDTDTQREKFSFALLSDSHYDYADLKNAITKINNTPNIDFVVHLGDMADHGLLKEYEIFNNYTKEINVPFLTAIGNHDYLSNGGSIYKQMFGDFNYTINYKGCKLVFFDATRFESNKNPDMEWFTNHLVNDTLPKLVFSHVPPWDDQYTPENSKLFEQTIKNSNVVLSMHGHHHEFYYGNIQNTEVNFLINGSTINRNLVVVTINADNSHSYQKLPF